MAPPYQIPSSAQQKRKYTMLDDYVNAIQWENFTNVPTAPRLGTTPSISLQERGDFPVERSQLPSSSSSRIRQQQHTSLFSLLGLPMPASAPMFNSSETRVAPRDPTFPITGMSVPSTPKASLSGLRVPCSDVMVPSSESSVPFSATVLPSFGPRVPCSGPMLSLPGTRVPRCDTIVPSSEISIPFGASMQPSSGTRVPYNDSMLLLSGTRAPQGDAMVPSSDISVPINTFMLPPSRTRVSYSETMLPLSGTRVPCSGAMVPFSDRNVPFSASIFPLSGTRVPSSDPIFPLSGTRIPFSDPMFLPLEISVSSSPMFSSSGLRLPHCAPMFPSSEISVPFSTSMFSLSGTSVPHSDPMFLPSEISGPYGGPMFSSPDISARMYPSGRSAPYNATMFPSSGIGASCNNVPLFPSLGMESHSHYQSSQQSSLLHVSPEAHYSAPRTLPLLSQNERVHNTENTQKKARVFETGSSSDQGDIVSPIAEQLKTVTEFSQLLNEISVPNNTADDLSEDKLLVNSCTPIDSVWNTNCNTVDNNCEIEKMNNWWEKSYGHDSK